jgi:hypothetical protein
MDARIMVNFNGQAPVDMKLMDLRIAPLMLWAKDHGVLMDQAPVDMKLTMDLKDHSPIELTWAKDHGQFQWTKHSVDIN